MAQIKCVRVFCMKKSSSPISWLADAAQQSGSKVIGLPAPKDIVAHADDALKFNGTLIDFAQTRKIEFKDVGLMAGAQFREFALKLEPPGSDTKTELFESDLAVYGIAIYSAKETSPKLSNGPTAAGTQSPAIHAKQATSDRCPQCGTQMAMRIISDSLRQTGERRGGRKYPWFVYSWEYSYHCLICSHEPCMVEGCEDPAIQSFRHQYYFRNNFNNNPQSARNDVWVCEKHLPKLLVRRRLSFARWVVPGICFILLILKEPFTHKNPVQSFLVACCGYLFLAFALAAIATFATLGVYWILVRISGFRKKKQFACLRRDLDQGWQ